MEQDSYEYIWNQFTLRVKNDQRDALNNHLAENGIGCEIYYPVPMHQQQCFEHLESNQRTSLAVTDQLAAELLSIPIYPELEKKQQDAVIAALKSFHS